MTTRRGVWIALPVLVVMIGFLVVLATSDDAANRIGESPLVGRQAPPIAGEGVTGAPFDLADEAGEFVLVNFFQTSCIPCRQEHPELVNFARRHDRAGDASVVSVVYDDDPDLVRDFFDEFGGEWPVVRDPDGLIALDYGVAGVPESYLIGPDGVVVTKLVGGVTATGLDRVLADAQAVYG